jgi:hypothetical protein
MVAMAMVVPKVILFQHDDVTEHARTFMGNDVIKGPPREFEHPSPLHYSVYEIKNY